MVKQLLSGIVVAVLISGCAQSEEEYQRMLKESQRRQQLAQPAPPPQATKDDPSLKNIPVREQKPQPKPLTPAQTEVRKALEPIKPKEEIVKTPDQVITEVTKPKEPSLVDVLKDKVLVSPYTLVSPISGKWAWVPDPGFLLVLTSEGQMQYGPQQSGFYQMLSPTLIRFQITTVNGVSVGGTQPQDWQVAFFENNTVLLLSKGAQAMPFKRVE